MVPHLITALTGPINELEQRVLESMPAIERWYRLEWMEHTPPFYCSADLRNAGFKLAPVDTNLFPVGFNNLTADMLPLAVQAAMAAIEKICPEAKNLLLIPENRINNSSYLLHLQCLTDIFTQAGLNVRLGHPDVSVTEPTVLTLPDGAELTLEPLLRSKRRLGLKDFDPCTIVLNNDLAQGPLSELQGLHEQYLLPPLHAGWTVRRKSRHAQSYEEVAKKFAKLLGMDPWLIYPMHEACPAVDIRDPAGLDCVQTAVDTVLAKVRRKYKEYGINERPFAVIKPDDGSMGMGVLTVRDAKELAELAQRPADARLGAGNDSADMASPLIIQEGVPTYERMNDAVAEPVVCMIDRYVVGGYYRAHADRGNDENLNAPGSALLPLAFATQSPTPKRSTRAVSKPLIKPLSSAPNRFYMYGVIGRLAMLAASYELEATDPNAEVYE